MTKIDHTSNRHSEVHVLCVSESVFGCIPTQAIFLAVLNCVDHCFLSCKIHSFIHSRIYKAPLQEIYSEAPPAQPRPYRTVLNHLQNALSLFLGRIRISKGSPFQVAGPTMENARRCLVAVLARGTNSWPVAEQRRARRSGRPDTGLQSSQIYIIYYRTNTNMLIFKTKYNFCNTK